MVSLMRTHHRRHHRHRTPIAIYKMATYEVKNYLSENVYLSSPILFGRS